MKKISIFILLLALVSFSAQSQVTNYSLKLTNNGQVNFGNISELDGLSSYSVQFWVNPSAWNAGSVIFSRDVNANAFSAVLGANASEIALKVGSQSIPFASSAIGVNKWSQITIIADNGNISIYVNNALVKQQTVSGSTVPTSSADFVLGGNNFDGRIDEFRLWSAALTDPAYRLWKNTVNKYHPNWENLISYYKFDQNLCIDNIVDYKFKHHGSFVGNAAREEVKDNAPFKYLINSAYTDFGRWSDRMIDKEKYLMANDLIILGVETFADGRVDIPIPDNHGTVTNGDYIAEFDGRKGVLRLNGAGAQMNVGKRAIDNTKGYTFHTWFNLDKWVEGAYLFKKETSDTQGFSIRFGAEATKEVIVRLNGVEFKRTMPKSVQPIGAWNHIAIITNLAATDAMAFFMFVFNGGNGLGAQTYPTAKPASHALQGAITDALVGVNMEGKLDETVLWSDQIASSEISGLMKKLPMPSNTAAYDPVNILYKMNSNWSYDNPADLGYDSYSYRNFVNIMKSNYDGYRGYNIRLSVKGHDNWQNTFANDALRKKLAQGIVKYAVEFDGIDLDFEWCESSSCWNNYGLMVDEIVKLLPAEKVFSVSPHGYSYGFPKSSMAGVDFFTFQIYGPQSNWFTWNTYQNAYNNFVNYGYPKEKILMSYAAITSNASNGAPPIGVRMDVFEGGYTPDKDIITDAQGLTRYITGPNQTRRRAEWMQDNGCAGIFYWDMGNDVATSHKYSLAKYSNYAIASNVDSVVTSVIPTSVKRIFAKTPQTVTIYPNPASDFIQFVLPEGGDNLVDVKIFNTSGQLVVSKSSFSPSNKIDIGALRNGVYVLKVGNRAGEYVNSFVKIN